MNEVDNFILQKNVENGKGPSIGKHRTKRENFLADPAAYQEQIDCRIKKPDMNLKWYSVIWLSEAEKKRHA